MRVRTLLAALAMSAVFSASAVNIRVLVSSGPVVSVRVPINAGVTGLPVAGAAPVSYAEWKVAVQGANLSLNGQDSNSSSLYLPPATGSVVGIGVGDYRGGVLLRAAGGRVEAINIVDLEDYLRGVVPAEMPSSWPTEALKAQAVIARTYAVARISPGAAYDLCATEQCQVYGGVARETARTSDAIAQTRGLVISYAGKAARAVFSSDSGGYTASAGEVWGTDYPYLVAQPDPLSRSPKSEWSLSVPLTRVAEIAQRYAVRVGALQAVSITRLSASGRPLELTFQGTLGSVRLSGAEAGGFIRALGAHSTRVVFSGSDPLQVTGAGFGHGVGLSQWGASGLAAHQWNYAQILGFYYPGVGLSQLQEARSLPGGGSLVSFRHTEPLVSSLVSSAAELVNAREQSSQLVWSGADTQ